jgi:hypothetical protein
MRPFLPIVGSVLLFVGYSGLLLHDARGSGGSERRQAHAAVVAEETIVEAAAASEVTAEDGEATGAEEATTSQVQRALRVLNGNITRQSHPDALRYAFAAYFNYRSAHPEQVRKPYLYFVDYGLDSRTPRGYVFDMDALRLVEGPFMVAHGRGSTVPGEDVPVRFSNRNGSNATSLGLYLAQETYAFRGKSAGSQYRSVGLRLRGLSGEFNSAARSRGVVVHGAPYVTEQRAGRSEGCPAMEQDRAQRLLPRIADGGMVFHFSPRDPNWLRRDPWLKLPVARLASTD